MQSSTAFLRQKVDSCAWKSPSRQREENFVDLPVARVMDGLRATRDDGALAPPRELQLLLMFDFDLMIVAQTPVSG